MCIRDSDSVLLTVGVVLFSPTILFLTDGAGSLTIATIATIATEELPNRAIFASDVYLFL